MRHGVVALLTVAALATACQSQPPPSPPPTPSPIVTAEPTDDAELEPAAAALALVPEDATELAVTDFDELRLQQGAATLTSEAPAQERARFWRRAARTAPLVSTGLLLPQDERLQRDFGFTQIDVSWEAYFRTPTTSGWVIKFRDDLPVADLARAVSKGVGGLAGGTLDVERMLVSSGVADDPEESWAADPALQALVGLPAVSTYVATDCVDFEVAFASDVADELAPAPAAVLDGVDELGAYSVSFGGSLGTVRLGPLRVDVFSRARLAEVLPRTDPEFEVGYTDPVADPQGGRIGYRLADPPVAARLALEHRLPFAVCAP